jgi:carboxypeptidase Q
MKKVWILLCLLPLNLWAQTEDAAFIKKISDEMMREGQAYNLLHHLTKKIGGRLAGSSQFNEAVVWGAKTMQELGADTVFLQACLMPNWKRGGKDEAAIIAINNKKQRVGLDIVALGNSLGSGGKPIEASVLAVENFEELERRKDEVRGKIVYYNFAFNPTNINTGKSYSEAGIYRRSGASRAAKYGAVAVLIRSLTAASDHHPHTGSMSYSDSFPKVPAAALGTRDANLLWENCKAGSNVQVQLSTHGYFNPDTTGHNVVAEIRGSTYPNEYIVVGGHLDSWDNCEGAHDDGTGVVQTMEVLRTFKALGFTPKHTIRFVLFANEENGLAGGNKYAELAVQQKEQHIFALESDGGGFTPRGFGFTIAPQQLAKIQSWVDLLKPYGVYYLEQGGGGADIGPLNRKLQVPLAGLQPDGQRYFDIHHARTDVFEAVNKRELLLGAVNMAALIYLVDKYGLNYE